MNKNMHASSLEQQPFELDLEQKALTNVERRSLPSAKLNVQNALIAWYVELHLTPGIIDARQNLLAVEEAQRDQEQISRLTKQIKLEVQNIAMHWADPQGAGFAQKLCEILDRAQQAIEPDQLDKVQKDLIFTRRLLEIAPQCKKLVFDEELEMIIAPKEKEVCQVLTRLQKYLERELAKPRPLKQRSILKN